MIYKVDKNYLCRFVDRLPDRLHEKDGTLFYLDGNGESVDVGVMRSNGDVWLNFPLWAFKRLDGIDFRINIRLFKDIIAQAKENFSGYVTRTIKVPELEGQEVEFHWVGRNASHEFWLGIHDGLFVKRSVGEDWDEDGSPSSIENFYIREEEPGYLGHW